MVILLLGGYFMCNECNKRWGSADLKRTWKVEEKCQILTSLGQNHGPVNADDVRKYCKTKENGMERAVGKRLQVISVLQQTFLVARCHSWRGAGSCLESCNPSLAFIAFPNQVCYSLSGK